MKILLFGQVAEIANSSVLDVPEIKTLAELKIYINTHIPGMANIAFRIAVNHKLDPGNSLNAHDEIAILPPFAGG